MVAERETVVSLTPLSPDGYDAWLDNLVRWYADDNVRAGNWTAAEAELQARRQVEGLLAQGLATPNHHVLAVVAADGEQVGALWLMVDVRSERKKGFIADVEIAPPYRRRGYASAAMRALEPLARSLGIADLFLNVFTHNPGAIALYEKLGYATTSRHMHKSLA